MEYFKFEPVKFLAAMLGLGVAVITLLALVFSWQPEVILAINGVWAAFITVFGTFFTSEQAVSVKALEALAPVQPPQPPEFP